MLSTEQLKEKMKAYAKDAKSRAKACQEFYSKYLQGQSISGTVDGEKISIGFTRNGYHKLYDLVQHHKIVWEILPYIPEIITTGKYAGYANGYKTEVGGHQIFDGFLYFKKKVSTSKGMLNVVVDVGFIKRENSRQEYSFISNIDKDFRRKAAELKKQGVIIESVHAVRDIDATPEPDGILKSVASQLYTNTHNDATIPLSFEFVNVRIENIFEKVLESASDNDFHDNFSDVNYAFGLDL